MMYFILYLLAIVPDLKSALLFFCIAAGIVTVIATFFKLLSYDEDMKFSVEDKALAGRAVKMSSCLLALLMTLNVLIPDQKGIIMLLAGGATYDVLTSEPAVEIGGKGLKLLNQYLDSHLQELDIKESRGALEAN